MTIKAFTFVYKTTKYYNYITFILHFKKNYIFYCNFNNLLL